MSWCQAALSTELAHHGHGSYSVGKPGKPDFPSVLLQQHVVSDGFHAVDSFRDGDGFANFGSCARKPAKLHRTLVSLDIDFCRLEIRFIQKRCLDFGGDGSVIYVLAGAFTRGR